ncbi:MAG: MarR family transcriptional regulator [Promethearchaeota archaeon]
MRSNDDIPDDFDVQIKKIETDLVNFLVEGLVNYSGRDPIYAKVISYFFTRQTLTQKELRELTGLSAGAISQTLKQFEEMSLITTKYKEDKYGKEYSMDGISFGKSEYLMNIEGKYVKLASKLDQMKQTLDDKIDNMKEFDGFDKVHSLILQLLIILNTLPERLAKFEKDLAEEMQKSKTS